MAKSRREMWGETVLIEAPLSQVVSTGRDLIMMAKSLPVEIFFIHGCSQIPELYPRVKGLLSQERFYSSLSAIFSVIEQVDGSGKSWAAEMGIA